MKIIIISAFLFLCLTQNVFSQVTPTGRIKSNLLSNNYEFNKLTNYKSPLAKEDFDVNSVMAIFVCAVNPLMIYENKKINFGLTKEVSLAFPFYNSKSFETLGRFGIEYSYIFREERNHHLRSSFNVDIPYSVTEFIAFTYGFGAGYFTDFKKNGIFPQASVNMVIPVSEYLAINPYVKLRHTFMIDKTQSDNTDISVGVGFMFLSFF